MNHLFDALSAGGDGDAPLLILNDGAIISYDAFWRLVNKASNFLTEIGARPGDRIVVQVEKHELALAFYMAVLRAGCIFVPINTAYTSEEVAYFLQDAEPRLFVCDPARLASLRLIARAAGVSSIETLGSDGSGTLAGRIDTASDEQFQTVVREPDDLACLIYTSGTTGRSKGAMLTHDNLLSNARTLRATWHFEARDVLIHALPIYHAHGLFVACHTIMLAGASMIFLPRFDAQQVLDLMPQATSMMGIPTFYTRLLQSPLLTRKQTAAMRLFISGSAPLLAETHRAWEQAAGHRILERYGMTETTMITSNPYDGDRVAGSVGFPLDGVSLRIADSATGETVSPGEVGVIEVKGPNVFKGYWRMPDKTAESFRPDGYFITGDMARMGSTGNVFIVGREKDVVITGGLNVYPKEIEGEIDALPGVLESAVVGLPHDDFGEAVTAFVVMKAGQSLEEAQVIEVLRQRLAAFKTPKRVISIAELPRNAMGKVQKNQLRADYSSMFSGAAQSPDVRLRG